MRARKAIALPLLFSGNISAVGQRGSDAQLEVSQIFNTDIRSQAERRANDIERSIERRSSTLVIEFRAKDESWCGLKGWFGSWRTQLKARLAAPRRAGFSCL